MGTSNSAGTVVGGTAGILATTHLTGLILFHFVWVIFEEKAIRHVRCEIEDLASATVLRGKQNRVALFCRGCCIERDFAKV